MTSMKITCSWKGPLPLQEGLSRKVIDKTVKMDFNMWFWRYVCTSGSVVEYRLAKARVAGSNPVSCSQRYKKRDIRWMSFFVCSSPDGLEWVFRAILNRHSGDAVPQFRFQRYCDSGNRIPRFRSDGTVSFIMNSYALRRKFITNEVTIYDQVSWDHPAFHLRIPPEWWSRFWRFPVGKILQQTYCRGVFWGMGFGEGADTERRITAYWFSSMPELPPAKTLICCFF